MSIHPTAIVDPTVEVGADVEIGAYSVVGAESVLGDGVRLHAHVIVEPYTTLGSGCEVFSGAVLGGRPQDRKFKGEKSGIVIGRNNIIREHVTIHRASGPAGVTRLGDDNLIMAYCHIGHNCVLGGGITMGNMTGLSGHVLVEDRVTFGGIVGVHQFTRIGRLAMIGGFSKVVQDVPPFVMADGRPSKVVDLNVIGLRRSGISPRVRADIKQVYKLLYRSNLNLSQAIDAIEADIEASPERDYLLDFVRNIRFGSNGRQNDAPRV